jgi:hypothetical protein
MKKIMLITAFVLVFSLSAFAGKIDLAVSSSDVAVSPEQPSAGAAITVTVTVHNTGVKASKANYVQLKITKGTAKAYKVKNSIPAIPAGGSVESLFNVGTLAAGTYSLAVKADPANAVAEVSESNNKVTVGMTVTGGGTTGSVGQAAAAAYSGTEFVFDSMFSTFETGLGGGAVNSETLSNVGEIIRNIAGHKPETTLPCSKSGSFTMNYSLDSWGRPSKIEFTYNNCQNWVNQAEGTYYEGTGTLTMDLTYLNDSYTDYQISRILMKAGDGDPSSDTMPDYTTKYYSASGQTATYASDFTMDISIFGYNGDMPSDMGIYLTGVSVWTDFATNTTLTSSMNNLHIDVTITGTENDMTTTGVMAGTISFTNSQHACKNFTATYDNFNFTDHSTSAQSESTVNGQVTYSSGGLSGTFSITTLAPIVTPAGSDCPVSGKLSVTGSLGSATITYNSNGTISIDEGSNGSIDATIDYCNDAVNEAPGDC